MKTHEQLRYRAGRLHRTLALCVLWIVLWIATGSLAEANDLRTVALTGHQASGTPEGTVFSFFSAPVINNVGDVAFRGNLQPGVGDVVTTGQEGNQRGIWSEGSGRLALVARAGSHAPGTPVDAVFSGTFGVGFNTRLIMNDVGKVSFDASLRFGDGGVTTNNRNGIWSEQSEGLALVAREGDPAPNTPLNANFSTLGMNLLHPIQHVFNDAGQTVFYGTLRNDDNGMGGVSSSNRNGLWIVGSGASKLVVRSGDEAPGTSAGVVFSDFQSFVVNDAGETAFRANLLGGEVTGGADHGIWSDANGALSLIARKGYQAPGTPTGTSFYTLDHPVLNKAGKLAFSAALEDPLTADSIVVDSGVWAGNSDALSLVARTGMQAPGAPDGITFQNLWRSSVLVNQAGHTAFSASLQGPTGGVSTQYGDSGIWIERDGELELVARRGWLFDEPGVPLGVLRGTEVPGAAPGTRFEAFQTFALNASGQVAVLASTHRPGFLPEEGIWAQDRNGVLRLIAREGAQLDVDDGPGVDRRTINFINFTGGSGNEDGRPTGFNDRGELAFYARFTDNTYGVFVSNVVAIPEPSSVALAAAMVVLHFAAQRLRAPRNRLAAIR